MLFFRVQIIFYSFVQNETKFKFMNRSLVVPVSIFLNAIYIRFHQPTINRTCSFNISTSSAVGYFLTAILYHGFGCFPPFLEIHCI